MGDTYKAWLLPLHVAPDPDKEDQRAFLHPFWLMKTTANEDEANMEMHPKGHGTRRLRLDGQWKLPVARNTAVLEPGDALVLHRPAAALQPEAPIPETPRPPCRHAHGGPNQTMYCIYNHKLHWSNLVPRLAMKWLLDIVMEWL